MTTGGPEAPPPPPQGYAPPQGYGPGAGSAPAQAASLRVGAALIDLVPLIILFIVLGLALGEGESSDDSAGITLEGGSALLYFLLTLAYYVVTEAAWGATLGKRALGLVVRRVDGGRASFGQVLGRNVLRIVDGLPFLYLLGLIVMVATPRRQRLGDLAAGTVVVKRPPGT